MSNLKKVLIAVVTVLAVAGVITTSVLYFTKSDKDKKDNNSKDTDKVTEKVTVTYDLDGGVLANNSVEINKGAVVEQPATPTKPNHKFLGWYANPEKTQMFDFATIASSNLTIYAKWERTQYTVTYILKEEDASKNVVNNVLVKEGVEAKATDLSMKEKTYEGLDSVFEKWVLASEDKTANAYDFNQVLTNDLTLKAIYKEVSSLGSYSQAQDQEEVLIEGQFIYTIKDSENKIPDVYVISSTDGTAANLVHLKGENFKALTSDVEVNSQNKVRLLVKVDKQDGGYIFTKGNFIKFYSETLEKVQFETLTNTEVEEGKSHRIVNLKNVKFVRSGEKDKPAVFSINGVEVLVDGVNPADFEANNLYDFSEVLLYGKEEEKLLFVFLPFSKKQESEATPLASFNSLEQGQKVIIEGQILSIIKRRDNSQDTYLIGTADGNVAYFLELKDTNQLPTNTTVTTKNQVRIAVTVSKEGGLYNFVYTNGDFVRFNKDQLQDVPVHTLTDANVEEGKLYRMVNLQNLTFVRKQQVENSQPQDQHAQGYHVFSLNGTEVNIFNLSDEYETSGKTYSFDKIYLHGKINDKLTFIFIGGAKSTTQTQPSGTN